MTRGLALGACLALTLCACSESACGAETVRLPMEYRAWTLRDSTGMSVQLSQWIVPTIATATVGPRSRFVFSTALINSSRDESHRTASLTGPADLDVQLFHDLVPGHLAASAGVTLPTGKAELDSTDLGVVQALDPPLLGMRARQYGRGFAWNLGLAWTTSLSSRWGFGLCGGYKDFASYTLAAGTENFTGAAQTSISTGLRYRGSSFASGARDLDLRLTARNYGDDELGDRVAFRQDTQLETYVEGRAQGELSELTSACRFTWGGSGTYFQQVGGKNLGRRVDLGTFATLVLRAERRLGKVWRAGFATEWRSNGGSDLRERNGYSIAAGPCGSRALGPAGRVRVDARYLHGRLGEGRAHLDGHGFALSIGWLWTVR